MGELMDRVIAALGDDPCGLEDVPVVEPVLRPWNVQAVDRGGYVVLVRVWAAMPEDATRLAREAPGIIRVVSVQLA